jgi:2,3-bisphosphoglycerate-dependent phosphoglycerate mutase
MAIETHAHLLLVRHGESETNAANAFSGWADPEVTERGREQAKRVGLHLAEIDLRPDRVFTSELKRCRQTTEIILASSGRGALPVIGNAALNERDYGILTGLDKLAAAEKFGKEQVHRWRRSYAETPPGGESLQDTAARVLAYYVHTLLPAAMSGGATLVVTHGNTLRALIMALDGMDATAIESFDVSTGSLLLYRLAVDSRVIERCKLIG